jgi:hypothetical protein
MFFFSDVFFEKIRVHLNFLPPFLSLHLSLSISLSPFLSRSLYIYLSLFLSLSFPLSLLADAGGQVSMEKLSRALSLGGFSQ